MKKLKMPSPGTVIALIALAVALGGTAYAAKKISTKQLANSAVKTKKIANNAVTEAKIKDGAVTPSKLATDERVAWALIDGTSNAILAQSGATISIGPSRTLRIAEGEASRGEYERALRIAEQRLPALTRYRKTEPLPIALHARRLSFLHPDTLQRVTVLAPPPDCWPKTPGNG